MSVKQAPKPENLVENNTPITFCFKRKQHKAPSFNYKQKKHHCWQTT